MEFYKTDLYNLHKFGLGHQCLKYWVFTWFENKSAVCIFLQSVLKEIPYKDKRICSRADQKMPILRRKNKCILELVIQFEK